MCSPEQVLCGHTFAGPSGGHPGEVAGSGGAPGLLFRNLRAVFRSGPALPRPGSAPRRLEVPLSVVPGPAGNPMEASPAAEGLPGDTAGPCAHAGESGPGDGFLRGPALGEARDGFAESCSRLVPPPPAMSSARPPAAAAFRSPRRGGPPQAPPAFPLSRLHLSPASPVPHLRQVGHRSRL